MDERWADRKPQVMFDTFPWFHGEAFRFILDDLLALPRDRRILVDGFRLLPRYVKPLLASPHQAIWLISTPEFRVEPFTARGTLWQFPNKTTRPDKGLANHLARESIFADHLRREAEAEGVTTIVVDGSCSEDELLNDVRSHIDALTGSLAERGELQFRGIGGVAQSRSVIFETP